MGQGSSPATTQEEPGSADIVDSASRDSESIGHELRVELTESKTRAEGGNVSALMDKGESEGEER